LVLFILYIAVLVGADWLERKGYIKKNPLRSEPQPPPSPPQQSGSCYQSDHGDLRVSCCINLGSDQLTSGRMAKPDLKQRLQDTQREQVYLLLSTVSAGPQDAVSNWENLKFMIFADTGFL
jgi:hypothetical protein